jgi:hypothetical protein
MLWQMLWRMRRTSQWPKVTGTHYVRACVCDGAQVCKSGRPGPDRDSRDSENKIRKMADWDSQDSKNGIRKNGIRKNGIRKKWDSAFKPIGPAPAKTRSSLSVLWSCNSRATSTCMYAPSWRALLCSCNSKATSTCMYAPSWRAWHVLVCSQNGHHL